MKTATGNEFQLDLEYLTKMISKDYYVFRVIFYLHYNKLEFSLSKDFTTFMQDVPSLQIKGGDLIYKINGKLKFR